MLETSAIPPKNDIIPAIQINGSPKMNNNAFIT